MAINWKYRMECPRGHIFPVEPNIIVRVPETCPECDKKPVSWWTKRKMLRTFKYQLENFTIEYPKKKGSSGDDPPSSAAA